jgi:hypothetical protein
VATTDAPKNTLATVAARAACLDLAAAVDSTVIGD